MTDLVIDNLYDSFLELHTEFNSPKEIKDNKENLLINCPFHDDHHPTMNVYNVKDDKVPFGYGRCWACG